MKIIADTNIWYSLGQDNDLFKKVEELLICPTWINIVELSKTENVVDKEDFTRLAIQKMFHYKSNVIVDSPFIYLSKLKTKDEKVELDSFISDCLLFTERFAQGDKIDLEKQSQYYDWINKHRDNVTTLCDWFNEKSDGIKKKVNKKTHRKLDTFEITATFIHKIVELMTKGEVNLYDFDFEQIELFWRTIDQFFKELELSGMKMQPNDWFDFTQLAYVQPGDLFWTKEKRWIRIIENIGLQDYLYQETQDNLLS